MLRRAVKYLERHYDLDRLHEVTGILMIAVGATTSWPRGIFLVALGTLIYLERKQDDNAQQPAKAGEEE